MELSSRLPPCSKPEDLKQLNHAILKVKHGTFDLESVRKMTKCKRPCTYNVFNLAQNVQPIQTPNFTRVMLFMEGIKVLEKKEAYVYPWTSLVAEFGGTLGLFVGFSFLMVWDIIDEVLTKTHAIIKIRVK